MSLIYLKVKKQPPVPVESTAKVTLPPPFLLTAAGSVKFASDCKPGASPDVEELKDPRLEQVLRLAKRGCRLFPLISHSKVPMKGFEWKELATTDEIGRAAS